MQWENSYVDSKIIAIYYFGFSLYIWDWDDLEKPPRKSSIESQAWVPPYDKGDDFIPRNKACALILRDHIVYASHEKGDTFIVLQDFEGSELKRWSVGKSWLCVQLRSTRSGRFVVIFLNASPLQRVEGVSRRGGNPGYRLGVIDSELMEIRWLPTFFRASHLPFVHAAAVSEDGRYVVAVGVFNDGWMSFVDFGQEKVLWELRPEGKGGRWTVAFNDVCFSPDSKRIYVAGNTGLFCFDASDGKVLNQWHIPNRVVGVALSPDERLAAAGVPASGEVYICDATTTNRIAEPILRLRTGQYTLYNLAFSPDSTLLATEGVKNTGVKIWKMPPADPNAQNQTQ